MALSMSDYMTTAQYRTRLRNAGFELSSEDHAAHIIAASNGGPNHSDNYFFVYSHSFNTSIGAEHDEFNCYLAGLNRTERAVKVALQVSQDYTLRGRLEYNDRRFHDSALFRRVSNGISRRGYLRGQAPPGHRGDPSAPYTEQEIKLIAQRLYNRGKFMWRDGFMEFIQLTTMRRENALRPGEVLPTLDAKQVVDKYRTMLEKLDIDWPTDGGVVDKFHVKVHGEVWYRVDVRKVQQLAIAEGVIVAESEDSREVEDSEDSEEVASEEPLVNGGLNIETPTLGSYPLTGNLVSPIGATSPTQGPNTEHDPLQSPGTGTPYVCRKHSAGVNLYPTTNDDYDSGPERCKAMTSKGTQCKTGQKRGARMQVGLRTATRSVLPGRTPLCGIHLRSGNLALYPSANSDYDANPAICKAMVKNGDNRGKQCSKPRKN